MSVAHSRLNITKPRKVIRSAIAPVISAGVMIANMH